MPKLVSRLLLGAALMPCAAFAQQAAEALPPVDVYASADGAVAAGRSNAESLAPSAPGDRNLRGQALYSRRAISPDTAQLLNGEPGLSFYQGGGVSSLPVIHGLEDERNTVVLGGVPITAACANHMNPPLSYIDPSSVAGARC